MSPRHPLLYLTLSALLSSCITPANRRFEAYDDPARVLDPCFTTVSAPQALPSELLQAPTEAYVLGPGDKLDIEIVGEKDSRTDTFVTPDGKLYYNLLPGLDVAGLSTQQVKLQLEEKLIQYYRHPQVSVTLLEAVSQRVWVLGRLNQPGIYPLKRPLRVLDAISLAGGLFTSRFTGTTEELADLAHSFIVRRGERLPVDFQRLIRDGDLNQNIYLKAEDFIYLPSALTNEVYVLGAVSEPRPVGFMNEMNLVAVFSRGLGLRPDADLSRVSIIRGSLTDPKIAIVNAQDILNGKAANLRMQPGDIVYVPGAGQISPSSILHDAVNTFVRVVSANEGTNAAVGSGGPGVGLNVNVSGGN
jgi:protein involved in polysaccharide export with SLBB domain